MKSISTLLDKEVILAEENSEQGIWMKVEGDNVIFL